MTQFQVDTDQIRRHADTVATIASGLHDAAGTSNNLSGESLGIFVGFLTEALSTATNRTISAIGTAASTMDGVRTQLNTVANRYQDTDVEHAEDLQNIKDNSL